MKKSFDAKNMSGGAYCSQNFIFKELISDCVFGLFVDDLIISALHYSSDLKYF